MADGPPLTRTLTRLPRVAGNVLRCDIDRVGVLENRTGRHLIALEPIASGTKIFTLTGREIPEPTRYSVQVAPRLHLDQSVARDDEDLVRRYFWRYLDHACEPSTFIREREVIAVRGIAVGDGVTFNYNTTEYDMAEPFDCHCGSVRCVGIVRGARHLTRAQRTVLAKWLPDYLR